MGINTRTEAPEDLPPDLKVYPEEEQAAAFEVVKKLVGVWQWRHKYIPQISPDVFNKQLNQEK